MSVRYIAGDVGGTNARFMLVQINNGVEETIIGEKTYPSEMYNGLDVILNDFMREFSGPTPKACCLAVAVPVAKHPDGNQTVSFSNLSWRISSHALQQDTGINKVSIINDFVAVGYGLLQLEPEDVCVLNEGKEVVNGPKACLGAGTGLGEVYLTHNGEEYDVWGTEGGHTDYAARNKREFQLCEYLKQTHGLTRVSVERVVSGSAIPHIYDFLKQQYPESMTVARAFTKRPQERAAVISKCSEGEDSDRLCNEVMQMFADNYAAEAGDFALKTMCVGGLYIAGGIAPKILRRLREKRFLDILCDKGRMGVLLRDMPVKVVVNDRIGMRGAQVYARRLLSEGDKVEEKVESDVSSSISNIMWGPMIGMGVIGLMMGVGVAQWHKN